MNLIFYDRTATTLATDSLVSIYADGTIIFNTGAVRALNLQLRGAARLVRDADTTRWYACFSDVADRKAAVLGHRSKQGAALCFSHKPAARDFYEQFAAAAAGRKSVSMPLATAPTAAAGVTLYALDTSALGLPPVPPLPAEVAESAPVAAPEVTTPVAALGAGTEPAPEQPAAGLRPWTEAETLRVLAEGGTKAARQALATELGRSASAVEFKYYTERKKRSEVPAAEALPTPAAVPPEEPQVRVRLDDKTVVGPMPLARAVARYMIQPEPGKTLYEARLQRAPSA